ncbi:MAG TPA: pantoate--beta-alanine ligase [Streptosporangiaceae bacterium]
MIVRTRRGLAAARAALPGPVVLVPTMGALHDGHRSPLRVAREHAGPDGSVVVSIFVNPLQFGPAEDFDRYPRPMQQDLAVCAQEGVTAVFHPASAQMYPALPMVTVNPGPVGRLLEGASRPGFFDGVLTVVLKLFQLVAPDAAVFGAKDAQQLALIRKMAIDLDLGVQILEAPLHRDPDGLAASSRNAYLSAAERASARTLSRALEAARAAAPGGASQAVSAARALIDLAGAASPPVQLDYLALADPESFAEVGADHTGPAILLVAAKVGGTRLIDNLRIEVGVPAADPPGVEGQRGLGWPQGTPCDSGVQQPGGQS